MPSATEGPTVALSFANNFWGKDDAGVGPLLDRMASSKQTSDELRSFYSARATIEDDYARKLASLSRKALGSHEMGSLKESLDTVRGEIDSMAKQHASIAAQMKSELEEPLAAFAGGIKERRKIIQNTVEKILKVKIQQTHVVNKTRDRYEQDCLRIKGYLAQGHMVMGQEERKNKAKLEKTQISLASTNAEYEAAVKALEDTTARWNREWKAAADKFQDLEEERLDFTKSSLWTFANLASTVCVSDDASCEKIRLSLEKMDVEGDIAYFIKERGTSQEIPDPPKYINFCRGDMDDHKSEVSVDEDNYSVAQFPRSINPAFRTSSPQPSTYESHHDPNSALARDLGLPGSSPLNPEANVPSPQNVLHPPAMLVPGHPQAMALQGMPPQGMPPQGMLPQGMPSQMPPQGMSLQTMPPGMGSQAMSHGIPPQVMPPQSMAPRGNHPQVMAHQMGRPPTRSRQNSYPSPMSPQVSHSRVSPQQITHPSAMSHPSHIPQPSAMIQQDPYAAGQDRRGGPQSTQQQQYDSSQFSSVPHDPYPMDGMTMLCRTDGMGTVANTKGPSRLESGAIRPPAQTTSTDLAPRGAVSNSVPTSELPVRYERRDSNAPARYDVMKFPAGGANMQQQQSQQQQQQRNDGFNSSIGSNHSGRQELMNSANSSNISAPADDPSDEYSDPTSFSSQEPTSGKESPVKTTTSVSMSPVKATAVIASPVKSASGGSSPVKTTAVVASSIKNSPVSTSAVKASPFRSTTNSTSPVKSSPFKNTSGSVSPVKSSPFKSTPKADSPGSSDADKRVWKKRSGFFQNHSPFRRKSIKEESKAVQAPNRNTWGPVTSTSSSTPIQSKAFQIRPRNMLMDRPASPEPIDANASLALNVGENVFSVADAEKNEQATDPAKREEPDPIAMALAELKGAGEHKQPANRVSADRYHGIPTPVPEPSPDRTQEQAAERPQTQDRARPFSRSTGANSEAGAGLRGTPPPSYDMPVQRLGVPPPAVTSKAMQEASRKYTSQTRQVLSTGRPASIYNSAPTRSGTRHAEVPRAASPAPAPARSVSPQPSTQPEMQRSASPNLYAGSTHRSSTRQGQRSVSPNPYASNQHRSSTREASPNPYAGSTHRSSTRQGQRSVSPNPYGGSQHGGSPQPRRDSEQGYYRQNSPGDVHSRTASPASYRADYDRPVSRGGAMAVQLASYGAEGSVYGSVRSRGSSARPGTSASSRAMSFYDARDGSSQDSRQRSRSVADPSRQYTPEGRAILHYARALYMYQAAIPEELGFAKGDILAVLRHQDDGWWEAEIHSGSGVGQGGLVPSNYLQPC
ncbi:hypothetical protein GGR50DRAFT_687864 [Xylaria sp. CBS 124048]|nr:hypothetical protein GGR50DRAFT_687864 [Xylaria sp. CBS 124048]